MHVGAHCELMHGSIGTCIVLFEAAMHGGVKRGWLPKHVKRLIGGRQCCGQLHLISGCHSPLLLDHQIASSHAVVVVGVTAVFLPSFARNSIEIDVWQECRRLIR